MGRRPRTDVGAVVKRSQPLRRKTPMTRTRFERRKPAKKRGPRGDATGPGTEWADVRLQAAARAGWRCERCGAGLHGEFAGHHRKLRSQGGPDTIVNAVALCHDCHTLAPEAVHRQVAQARADGWIVRREADPAQVAVILYDGRTVRLDADGGYDVVWNADGQVAA